MVFKLSKQKFIVRYMMLSYIFNLAKEMHFCLYQKKTLLKMYVIRSSGYWTIGLGHKWAQVIVGFQIGLPTRAKLTDPPIAGGREIRVLIPL